MPTEREPDADPDRWRQELIMSSPVAQLVVTPGRQLALVNDRAGTLLGLSERDIGRPFSDLDIADTIAELGSRMAAALDGRDTLALHGVPWRRPAAAPAFVDIQLVPLLDIGGNVLGLSISLTDVTRLYDLQVEVETANRQLETAYQELRSTNEELGTSNEELQSTVEELATANEELRSTNEELDTKEFILSIFNSLDAAVIVVDRDLVVQLWGGRSEELWGLREQEVLGHQLLTLDNELPVEELRAWLLDVVGGGRNARAYGHHISTMNRHGRQVELRVTATAMSGDSTGPTGALVLLEELPSDDVDEEQA